MPRKPDGDTPRDTYLRVRLTAQQKASAQRRASEVGMSLSEWVRMRIGGGK